MSLTRRTAMQLGIVTPAALLLGGVCAPTAFAAARSPYERATWTPHLGGTFTMTSTSGSASVVLTSIEDLAGAPANDPRRFSLSLRAAAALVPHGTVTLQRRGFGGATLFVTSVDRGLTATNYQAVINRPA